MRWKTSQPQNVTAPTLLAALAAVACADELFTALTGLPLLIDIQAGGFDYSPA
jgi:hypothetical protein